MLKKGHLLLDSGPFVHILSQKSREKYCDHCFSPGLTFGPDRNLLRCSACTFVRYCDVSCQKKSWKMHKEECKCLQRVLPKIPTDSARLFYHLILKHKNGELKSAMENGRSFDQFISHEEDLKKDAKRQEEFVMLCRTIQTYTGGTMELPPAVEMLQIFGRMAINSFSICDTEMQPIGTGVYLAASQLDHRCNPNAVITYKGTSLQLRLTQDTPTEDTLDLKKVYISYIDSLSCTEDRQRQLQEQYYFTCTCELCSDTYRNDCMTSLLCPNTECQGHFIHNADEVKCDTCGNVTPPKKFDKIEAESSWKQILEHLAELKAKPGPEAVLECAATWLSNWELLIHEDNIYYARILDYACDACIDTERWSGAAVYMSKTIPAYQKYYGVCHPNLAVQLYKLGKMELYIEDLDEASTHLQQALRIIEVTHGDNSPFTLELRQLLHQCDEQRRLEMLRAESESDESGASAD